MALLDLVFAISCYFFVAISDLLSLACYMLCYLLSDSFFLKLAITCKNLFLSLVVVPLIIFLIWICYTMIIQRCDSFNFQPRLTAVLIDWYTSMNTICTIELDIHSLFIHCNRRKIRIWLISLRDYLIYYFMDLWYRGKNNNFICHKARTIVEFKGVVVGLGLDEMQN